MKLLAFAAIVGIASVSGIPQDQTQLQRWACWNGSKCQKSSDPQPATQEFARTAKVGRYWPEERRAIVATFAASRIDSDQEVFRLKGSAEIATDALMVHADEADYHWDTGEIEARGNVHIKPFLTRLDRGLTQFGIK